MVLGICLSFPKMGSSLNNYISPMLADRYYEDKEEHLNVAVPIFVGAFFMSVSLVLAVGNYAFTQCWHGLTAKAKNTNNYNMSLTF